MVVEEVVEEAEEESKLPIPAKWYYFRGLIERGEEDEDAEKEEKEEEKKEEEK